MGLQKKESMIIAPLSDEISPKATLGRKVKGRISCEGTLSQCGSPEHIDAANNDLEKSNPETGRDMETTTSKTPLSPSPNKTTQNNQEINIENHPRTPINSNQPRPSPCSLEVSFSKPNETSCFNRFLKSQSEGGITIGAEISASEEKLDDYVRSGTHVRSLLDYAFRKISSSISATHIDSNNLNMGARSGGNTSRKRNFGEDEISLPQDEMRPLRRRRLDLMINHTNENDENCDVFHCYGDSRSGKKYTSELAREMMAEILKLKRALKESEEHAVAMTQVNKTLREASETTSANMSRTTEALRIAGKNAADARADADAAELRTASLTKQINSMTTVLNETKRTCDSIRKEHDEISAASRSLEARLIQTESDLNRVDREKRESDEHRDALSKDIDLVNMAKKNLQTILDQKENEVSKLKRKLKEMDDVETVKAKRTNHLETELREAKTMLADATSAATEAESTIGMLQESIKELHRENKTHHDKISEIIETSAQDKERIQNSLFESEKEAQKLRLKVSLDEEELQRLKLDQKEKEKEISQLQNKIATLEKRMDGMPSSSANDINNNSPISKLNFISSMTNNDTASEDRWNCKEVSVIPPLRPNTPTIEKGTSIKNYMSSKKRATSLPPSARRQTLGSTPLRTIKCCICFKHAYGIMKSCQCGNPVCAKRAHASCITGKNPLPSVSHPGTPAPLLPCILCKINSSN